MRNPRPLAGEVDLVVAIARMIGDGAAIADGDQIIAPGGQSRRICTGIDEIITGNVTRRINLRPDLGQAQRRAIAVVKHKIFDRIGTQSAQNDNAVAGQQPSDQIIAIRRESDLVLRHAGLEFDRIGARNIQHAVLAIAKAKQVDVIAGQALQLIRTLAAIKRIAAIVKADDLVIASGAHQQPVLDIFQGPDCPVGKQILLNAVRSQPVGNGQHIAAVAQVNQQIGPGA